MPSSGVKWNGTNRPTTFLSPTRLQAQIAAADIAQPGLAGVTVFTPEPGGGESNVATFTIGKVGDNPVPVLESATLTRSSNGSLRLTLKGSGFVAGATVQWNGANRPTSVVDSTHLTIGLTGVDILGTPSVLTVVNPAPGGGMSNELVFGLQKVRVPLIRR